MANRGRRGGGTGCTRNALGPSASFGDDDFTWWGRWYYCENVPQGGPRNFVARGDDLNRPLADRRFRNERNGYSTSKNSRGKRTVRDFNLDRINSSIPVYSYLWNLDTKNI